MVPGQSPGLDPVTALAFALHVTAGSVALFSGFIAAFAHKGGRVHRKAGTLFFGAMLVMATFAAYLAVVRPGQLSNLGGAIFTGYLVATAWLTVRRPPGASGVAERIALGFAILLTLPFIIQGWLALTGRAPDLKGPFLIAFCSLAAVIVVVVAGDAKVVMAGGIAGAPRIARHLWRMCLGLLMATGSAFTNGLPRVLPGPWHMTVIPFLPMLVPLGLLIFWMIRVRFTGWFARAPLTSPA